MTKNGLRPKCELCNKPMKLYRRGYYCDRKIGLHIDLNRKYNKLMSEIRK